MASGQQQQNTPIEHWITRAQKVLLNNYRRKPLAFTRGQGSHLWDTTGKEYIDFASGIAVSALGHAHPSIVHALQQRSTQFLHLSNLYYIPEQVELAERLQAWLGYEKFFFCNSGTEANEALIKLARAWGKPQGRWRIIVAKHGFHGRTMGALSATAQKAMQEPFEPMLPGFDVIAFNDLAAAKAAITPQTAAILVEPIQAEGGGTIPVPQYLPGLRELCNQEGILLLFDEIQTGIGRTGYPLASLAYNIKADAVSLAKGLGAGIPIGAIAVNARCIDSFQPGDHGSTFGGNPFACSIANTVIKELANPAAMTHVKKQGEQLLAALKDFEYLGLKNPRGQGLFVCFTIEKSADFYLQALNAGLLVAPAKLDTIRLLPSLVIDQADLLAGIMRLQTALEQHQKQYAVIAHA